MKNVKFQASTSNKRTPASFMFLQRLSLLLNQFPLHLIFNLVLHDQSVSSHAPCIIISLPHSLFTEPTSSLFNWQKAVRYTSYYKASDSFTCCINSCVLQSSCLVGCPVMYCGWWRRGWRCSSVCCFVGKVIG